MKKEKNKRNRKVNRINRQVNKYEEIKLGMKGKHASLW
jgi:hypothetical protein